MNSSLSLPEVLPGCQTLSQHFQGGGLGTRLLRPFQIEALLQRTDRLKNHVISCTCQYLREKWYLSLAEYV